MPQPPRAYDKYSFSGVAAGPKKAMSGDVAKPAAPLAMDGARAKDCARDNVAESLAFFLAGVGAKVNV